FWVITCSDLRGHFFLAIVRPLCSSAVAVAQLVESRIVIPVVVGSSPISHPKIFSSPVFAAPGSIVISRDAQQQIPWLQVYSRARPAHADGGFIFASLLVMAHAAPSPHISNNSLIRHTH